MAFNDGSGWYDLSNVPGVLDWWAFGLGTAGIAFTIFQLLKQSGALKAAAKALKDTRDILIDNQLVFVLPGFNEISNSIDASLRANNRDQIVEGFSRFIRHGEEAMSLFTDSPSDFSSHVREIKAASRLVKKARSDLFLDNTTPLVDLVGDAATSVRDLTARLHGVAVSIKNDPGKAKQHA